MVNVIIGVFVVFFAILLGNCSSVPAGNVGVKIDLYGNDKGVSEQILPVGRYYIGFGEELYKFPTYLQNHTWKDDDSFSFQTKEGLPVNADIGISYAVLPDKVAKIFQTYRRGIDEITDTFIRNQVRDALVSVASTKPIDYVYGEGKKELMLEVEDIVRKQNEGLFTISQIYWIGELRLPDSVKAAINAKVEATQRAILRENEIQQTKAEAQKAIEEARGLAESKLMNAKAEAESVKIRGEAEAEAIEAKSKALNSSPQLVQYEIARNWDGHLPTMMTGNSVPMIHLPEQK
jgi:regulator of protease activity HflC (stomatin/prohibitin superfamily)